MEERIILLQDRTEEQEALKKSLSKEAQKWYDALFKFEEIEWECLRRNEDYKNEYEELTQTDDFKNMTDPMDDIFGERHARITYDGDKHIDIPYKATLQIFGKVAAFCSKWNLQYPKDPKEPFDWEEESQRLFEETKVYPLVSFTTDHLINKISGARDALALVKRHVERTGVTYEEAIEQLEDYCEQKRKEISAWRKKRGRNIEHFAVDIDMPDELILHAIKKQLAMHRDTSSYKGEKRKRPFRDLDLWPLILSAWDLRQPGMTYSDIADEFANEIDGLEEKTVERWIKKADVKIRQMGRMREPPPHFP